MPGWMRTIAVSAGEMGDIVVRGGIWRNSRWRDDVAGGVLLGIGVVGYTVGVLILARTER